MTAIPTNLQGPGGPGGETFGRPRTFWTAWSRVMNVVAIGVCCLCAALTLVALFSIFSYILYRGFASINWAFFTRLPAPSDQVGGMRNCIAGTLTLVAMAAPIGIPIGMFCGIYLSEYAKDNALNHGLRLVVDVLAGVPSILIGVLAYILVVKPMGGNSAYAGAVALGFMMCPIIARTTEEMLKLVPKALREASIGLGSSKAQTLLRVVIPAASSGIITGIMLAVARIAGETAPLLFTVLGSDQPVFSWGGSFPYVHADLNHAFPTLTVQIYKYAQSAEPEWINEAWAGMLVLIVLVLVLNICVRVASARKRAR